jgi:type II secretory pathway predicted ATPase ExeA
MFSASGRSSGPRLVHSSGDEQGPSVVSRLAPAAAEPFADDAAGAGYFSTDYHHRFLVGAIRERLAKARGFVLVSGEPAADGEMLARYLTDEKESGYRVALVRCRTGMVFDDLVRAYSRQLGLRADDDSARLWALLSHLMLETRNGVTRILVVENADALDIRTFDELHRFARLDDPHLMSVVLLATPSFAQRLDAAPLNFLKPAIVGQVAVQHLHADEVGAFIHYQLNTVAPHRAMMLNSDDIGAIAAAANGNPATVNRLARQALVAKSSPPAPEPVAAKPIEPVVRPIEPVAVKPIEPALTKPIEPAAAKPVEPAAMKPIEPAAVKPIPAPAPKLPPAALPVTPKPIPVVKILSSEPSPAKPLPVVAKAPAAEPSGEDPIPNIPLVLPSPSSPPAERSDAAAAAVRAVRAARMPAPATPTARKALSDAEHHAKPAIAPPLADMPAVPLSPAANEPDPDLDDETPPLAHAKRQRPQMASGVAAVIYLAAVVLSGALLLYIFDPGLRRDQVPLLSATATIPPPPPSETVPTVQPVATALVPEPPPLLPPAQDVPASRAAGTATPLAPVPAEVPVTAPAVAASDASTPRPAPAKEATTDSRPVVTTTSEAPLAPAAPTTAPVSVPTVAVEPPNEADTRSAVSVEPAAPPPAKGPALAVADPAAKSALPSDLRAPGLLQPKLQPPPRDTDTVVTTAPPPVSSFERPPAAELVLLVRRGDEFLAAGDIVSARHFFERAAKSGDPEGALGLGKSYDPLYLRQAGVRGVGGDPAKAATWYRSAAVAGNAEAALRLKRLEAAYPPQ